jgi:hypothetical protein
LRCIGESQAFFSVMVMTLRRCCRRPWAIAGCREAVCAQQFRGRPAPFTALDDVTEDADPVSPQDLLDAGHADRSSFRRSAPNVLTAAAISRARSGFAGSRVARCGPTAWARIRSPSHAAQDGGFLRENLAKMARRFRHTTDQGPPCRRSARRNSRRIWRGMFSGSSGAARFSTNFSRLIRGENADSSQQTCEGRMPTGQLDITSWIATTPTARYHGEDRSDGQLRVEW